MPDEDKTFSGSLVLDLRIWCRHVHTLYSLIFLEKWGLALHNGILLECS